MSVLPARRRSALLAAMALTIGAGLASRSHASPLPATLGGYPGDALWAMLVFLCLALVWPRAAAVRLALAALALSFAVEAAQLYQAPWIRELRATTAGHLVLGQGFDPLDLLAYAVGVAMALLADRLLPRASR